jgi:DNA invertase Pin-like site-specific DNA recombinase
MLVGYAKSGTIEQEGGLEDQLRELTALGCGKIFQEQISSVGRRKALEEALEFTSHGDTLVVTRLDRLARSIVHLGEIVQYIRRKGVDLRILDLAIDTSTATGELALKIMGAVAQFERLIMLERQLEGIAKAKAEGKYKGRKPTARAKTDQVKALKSKGATLSGIARQLGIGKTSVHRILTSE